MRRDLAVLGPDVKRLDTDSGFYVGFGIGKSGILFSENFASLR
jgi:hypothetical protein